MNKEKQNGLILFLWKILDPNDKNLTIEGYEAPKRVYVRIKV